MALGYAWFDSYDSVGYVLTLHISPHTLTGMYRGHFFSSAAGEKGWPFSIISQSQLLWLAL
eukprot:COSAG05_NODE_18977_length_299_cov_4.940000_1_plen_60_part_10